VKLNLIDINSIVQTADWKKEKHVPVIDLPKECSKGQPIIVNMMVGKEISHPNTTEHHIRWMKLFFKPNGEKYAYEIGKAEFNTHGESIDGPNKSTVYSDPVASFQFKTEKPGMLIAFSYCNIHGLWQNSKDIKV